jgi:hypothetical protein
LSRHVRRVRATELLLQAWPPVDGDEGFQDHLHLMGTEALSEVAYAEAVQAFAELVMALDAGVSVSAARWSEALGVLGVCADAEPSPEPVLTYAAVPTTQALATVATDFVPEVADDAIDALLGPWAAVLELGAPHQRWALLAALAASAFTRAPGAVRSAVRAWSRDRPRATDEELAQLRAASRAPYFPWHITEISEQGWCLSPVVPLADEWVPKGAVKVDPVGWVDTPPAVGSVLFARVVPVGDGWRVICAVTLPEAPPAALVMAWLRRAMDPDRVENRMLRYEDGWRRHGHHVCGQAHRWWWAACQGADVPRRDS